MIIKGKTRTNGGSLADYLLSEGRYKKNKEKNERIEVWEATGLEQGDRLKDILSDFEHSAAGTQCEKPLFHVQFRTDTGEHLTRAQWMESINRLEDRLELSGHERVIVAHTLEGQQHVHVAWNRIDAERQKAAELHYYKHKCTDLARELERDFGLRELSDNRKRGKLSRDEEQQAIRNGQKPQEIKTAIRECWQQSENGQDFSAALEQRGYILAKGDRRDFVIIDELGGKYSVARVTGSKAAEVRERLADVDRENLPSVDEAKEIQHDRAHGLKTAHELEQWDNALAAAAIEKSARAEQEARRELMTAQEAEIKIQAESVQDFKGHQAGVKQERDAAQLDKAAAREPGAAQKIERAAEGAGHSLNQTGKAASRLSDSFMNAVDSALDCLVGAPPPKKYNPSELARDPEARRASFAQKEGERERTAALDRMAEHIKAGKEYAALPASDVRHLNQADLANIKAHGGDGVRLLVEERERERRYDYETGRQRKRER